jgi:hypothetical protein
VARDKRNTNGELASDFVAAATAASHATLDLCFARPICRRTRGNQGRFAPSALLDCRCARRRSERAAGEWLRRAEQENWTGKRMAGKWKNNENRA